MVSKLASPDWSKHETGGNFSTCYKVEKNGETAFMKVMDYAIIIMMMRGGLTAEIMKRASSEFNYEKKLLSIMLIGIYNFPMI